jgi:hypothetical protein
MILAKLRDRLGHVTVDYSFIDALLDIGGAEREAQFNAIFKDLVIVEAEPRFSNHTIRYTGYHPLFDVTDRRCAAPHYEAVVNRSVGEHGIISFDVQFTKLGYRSS